MDKVMEQLTLLDEPQKQEASSTEYRIVVVDEHIIAQFNQNTGSMGTASWYTCNRSEHNDERDFAVWPFSEENLSKAFKLIGCECRVIEPPVDYYTEQHNDGKWYIHRGGEVGLKNAYDTQNMALRNLAQCL